MSSSERRSRDRTPVVPAGSDAASTGVRGGGHQLRSPFLSCPSSALSYGARLESRSGAATRLLGASRRRFLANRANELLSRSTLNSTYTARASRRAASARAATVVADPRPLRHAPTFHASSTRDSKAAPPIARAVTAADGAGPDARASCAELATASVFECVPPPCNGLG